MGTDARIPVLFVDGGRSVPDPARLLVIAEQAGSQAGGWAGMVRLPAAGLSAFGVAPGSNRPGLHPPGCVCCVPRSAQAAAFGALIAARARGEVPYFRALAVDLPPAQAAALRAALASDPWLAAGFIEIRPG